MAEVKLTDKTRKMGEGLVCLSIRLTRFQETIAALVFLFFFFFRVSFHLWYTLLCFLMLSLEERVLSQWSHEKDTSKCLISIWSLIWLENPSLPHTLQMRDTSCLGVPSACLPDGIIFWPFSIIDLTFSSSAWRSALIFHSQLLLLLISCLAHLLRVLD